MIALQGISKGYAGKELFSGLSWHVDAGERIGMIGPNGVGKTTLARIIAGLEQPDEGDVGRVRGRLVGYLAQEVTSLGDAPLMPFVVSGRPELVEARARVAELEREVAEQHAEQVQMAYAAALDRLQELGGYSADAEAGRILSGLGFAESDASRLLSTLSGGWRMRAALARLLFRMPDLLILDEPTNHLDLPALAWLESFLDSYKGAYLVISHDRTFLNTMVDKIVELEEGALSEYPGGYDNYVVLKERQRQLVEAKRKNQERRIAQIERFIERFRAQKTKARQVGSRKKMVELLEAELVDAPRRPKRIRFSFPQPERGGTPALTLEGVDKAYGDVVVYRGMSFSVARGDRVALVGPNGAGKSTLLKLAAGVLRPDAGARKLGHNVRVHYFAQHLLDALDTTKTPLQEMTALPGWEKVSWLRSLLGALLLGPKEIETRVADLSGGEKAKLALAKMLLKPANLLLLDEPTNHLDPQAREALEGALAGYSGSMVFISHDRAFINRLANRVVEVVAGRLTDHIGNYDDYLRAHDGSPKAPATAPLAAPVVGRVATDAEAGGGEARERRRRRARLRAQKNKATRGLRGRIEEMEKKIASAEKKLEEIHFAFADPDLAPERLAELGREEKAVKAFLEDLYRQWESASAELEEVERRFAPGGNTDAASKHDRSAPPS